MDTSKRAVGRYPDPDAPAQNTPEADRSRREASREVTQDARRRSQEVVEKAAHEAQLVAGRLRDQAGGALNDGKAQLVGQIGGVARALKASSRQFRDDDLGDLAVLSDGLAAQVEAVQRYLDTQSGDALLEDVKRFARRRRGLFVGSLLVAGLLAARFAQSTPVQRRSPQSERPQTARVPSGRSTTVVTAGNVRRYPGGRR
jgi:hypothetical protein